MRMREGQKVRRNKNLAAGGVSLPNFLPFPRIVGGPVRGICEFDTLFPIFSCFLYPKRDTRVTRRVVKYTLFTRFYLRG